VLGSSIVKRTARRLSHLWHILTRRDRVTADMDDEMRFGVVVGSVMAAGAFTAIGVGAVRAMPLLLIVAAIMTLVALLATLGPARRGVRIPAMEALRAEA
jgi:hypothetical protein